MKTNWQTKKLGEICEVVGGGTPSTSIKEYWDNDYYWVTPKDLGQLEGFEISKTERKISKLGLKNSSAKLLPAGSVILSSRAPIGYVFINTVEMATNQGCRSFVCGGSILNKYLYYFLVFNKEYLNKIGTGTTFKEVSGSALKEIEIPLPPLSEQKRIVKILDEAFEKLEKAKENTEKNLQNSRELFESYLNDIFSKPRKDWEEKTLKEVCEKITDGTHQTPTYFESGYIFLSSKNVTSGKIDWDNVRYIDKKQHIEMQKRVSPRRNDILLAKNGTTGVAAIVDKDEIFDIYVSLAHIRTLDFIDPRFMLHFVNSPVAKRQFNKRLKGSGVPNLHLEEIREVLITFPKSIQEQKTIVKKLDQLSEKTQKLEVLYKQKLENIEELKKSILQKAFSGEL